MAKYSKTTQSGYGLGVPIPGIFPSPINANRNPTTADRGEIGQLWVNSAAGQAWIASINAGGLTTWVLASPGASDVDTLTGDAGGPISPVLGDIVLAGGTNIGTTGAGNTVTFNLDPAIVLATSVSSPLYTSAAADVLVVPGGVNDIVLRLGDAAGATFLRVQSSAAADVFTVDSTGVMTFAGLTVTGAFTQTGGIANIGSDAAANAINIGTGAAAKPIIIGNSTGATSIALNCGTGALNIGTNAIAHTVTIGNVTGATAVNVNSGTGACAWTTTNGSFGVVTGTGAINIGADAFAKTITVGNTTGATIVNITTGTGGSTYTTTNGAFALNTGTGAIGIGTDAAAKTITVGNVTGATAVNVNSGTGACAWTTTNGTFGLVTGTGAINLGTDAAAKTITIGNATAATSVIVDGGTGAMSFGANAIAHTTTIGTTTGAGATTVQAGTGLLSVNGGGIVEVDSVGVLELNSSGGVIGIGNDAVAQNINIGTGAAARTITIGNGTGATSVVINNGTGALNIGTNATVHTTTIGSNTGASATIIQSGSGKIDFAGVVAELTADFIDVSGDKITFRASPIAQSILPSCVIPTGVAGTTDLLAFENGIIMEQFIIGTQTILAPRMGAAALGLTVSCDLTNAEGKEYNFGADRISSKHSFTIGTSPAFYMELRFTCLDVSALEPAYFGFRKTQANQAAYGTYTDFVGYGLNDGVAPGDCAISTRLNSGAQVDTDTNDAWADGSTHTLRVMVSAAGVVTFLFDGAPPTVTQAFTFDNGDVVHPFWSHLFNATAGAGDEIYWISMEVGNQ